MVYTPNQMAGYRPRDSTHGGDEVDGVGAGVVESGPSQPSTQFSRSIRVAAR